MIKESSKMLLLIFGNSLVRSGMEILFMFYFILDEVLCVVYVLDMEMYFVGLLYDRFCSWVVVCFEMLICWLLFKMGIFGVVIVLFMLREYWEDLLVGKLKEFIVDVYIMFFYDNKRE